MKDYNVRTSHLNNGKNSETVQFQNLNIMNHHHVFEFHFSIFRTLGDKLGEAKASGNLGNTLKVLGKFDEAIACCERHLDISRELNDKVMIVYPFRSNNLRFRVRTHANSCKKQGDCCLTIVLYHNPQHHYHFVGTCISDPITYVTPKRQVH